MADFFGPIMVDPGANQGPLLGIFIIGPLGVLAGAIPGGVLPRVVPERVQIGQGLTPFQGAESIRARLVDFENMPPNSAAKR